METQPAIPKNFDIVTAVAGMLQAYKAAKNDDAKEFLLKSLWLLGWDASFTNPDILHTANTKQAVNLNQIAFKNTEINYLKSGMPFLQPSTSVKVGKADDIGTYTVLNDKAYLIDINKFQYALDATYNPQLEKNKEQIKKSLQPGIPGKSSKEDVAKTAVKKRNDIVKTITVIAVLLAVVWVIAKQSK